MILNFDYSLEMEGEQQDKIQLFQEISQLSDPILCREILEENGWNVDAAVDSFMSGRSSGSRNSRTSSAPSSSVAAGPNNGSSRNTSGSPIWRAISWLFHTEPVQINAELDTRRFIADFERSFGTNHPPFVDSSYQACVAEAFRSSRFLIVYLHSPHHEDTPSFCRQVLCTQPVSQLVERDSLMWAGRVLDTEAYSLCSQFGVATFPFIALLVCQSERSVQIAVRIQGSRCHTLQPSFLNYFILSLHSSSLVCCYSL